jgi:sialate O-acetylesterase
MIRSRLVSLVLGMGLAAVATAQQPGLRLTHLYSDHMVLPAERSVPVRGFGAPGAAVELMASWGATARAEVGADGRFTAALRTPGPGGPHELTVQSGAERLQLRDLRSGIVLLASGQSNMEMPLGDHGGWRGGTRDWQREVAAARDPELRFFTVAQAASGAPATDVDGAWLVCTPDHAPGFSATAYYCAKQLRAARQVPVGVVVAAWGGTVAEAWTSPAGLAAFPEFAEGLRDATRAPDAAAQAAARTRFWNAVPVSTPAGGGTAVTLPELWSAGDLADFDGVAFYARSVTLPAGWAGHDLQLELGAIDDCDTVFLDGERLGGMEGDGAWNTPRQYAIPAARTAADRPLRLLVRVLDTGGEGGFAGPAEALRLVGPDGKVPLAGTWTRWRGPALADLPAWPRDRAGGPNRPAVLWHGMVAPLLPFPFTAVLWYQGESNVGRAEQYARLLPAMVTDWRRANGDDLPFFGVQIAPHRYRRKDDAVAQLRLAQAAILALPRTGLVGTLDCGDAADIHPVDKAPVGQRLAAQVLATVFGGEGPADGPQPARVARAGAAVRLEWRGAEGGLQLADAAGFELAGADGVFHAAPARLDGTAVLVATPAVPVPEQVRYAHAEVPTAALRNGAGWPARPFVLPVAAH